MRTQPRIGHRGRRRIAGVVAAVLALGCVAMTLSPTAGAADIAPAAENPGARGAVLALTGPHPERAVIPADFGAAQGYLPVEVDGVPVDPGGQCSSPIPLPAEFDTACKAHDLGYDLLRYAELHGHPLGPWARRAVDATLEQHMYDACATRDGTLARLHCDTMAAIATGAVDLNSRRQNYAAPMPEYLFGAQLSGSELGPQLVRVLASVAMVLLLVAALFAVVRRLIRPARNRPGTTSSPARTAPADGPAASGHPATPVKPAMAPSPLPHGDAPVSGGTGVRWRHHRPGRLIDRAVLRRDHRADDSTVVERAIAGLRRAFATPVPVVAIAAAGGLTAVPRPGWGLRTAALRTSQPNRRAGVAGPDTSVDPARRFRDAITPPVRAIADRARVIGRRARVIGHPRIGTLVASAAGIITSLWPGLLPRTSIAQALLTAVLILVPLAVAGLGRKILGRFGIDVDRRLARHRVPIAVACAIGSGGALGYAWYWQNRLRAAMDFPATGPAYWLHWALGVIAVVIPILLVLRGLRRAARYVGRLRAAALITATVLACQFALLPAAVNWQRSAFATADTALDPDVVQPVSFTRSGSPESAVSWSSLGAEGRKFVSERGLSARVYIGLRSAPDLDSRVALAIRELERSGGFERGNLVMMVPTGSGWLDANAAHGLDQRFGGDATLIGMQYSQAPSWATFLFARADAERSARALFTGIERHLAGMAQPPKLYVYGQSLGATAGSAIFADDRDGTQRVCAALWAGPPAAAVHRGGAAVLANSSDPVVQWSPRLLWHAPDLGGTRRDAPHPPWLPVLGWLQTTADMLSALAPGPGHGHRYGTDQGTALGSC
ncbi:alpha/beta-hydrolase family protein [Nocardia sp. NPDC052254]|uniref:alpha/beta-hydrolase family protein n=1 Tax=Nocardia sp. NPDC052254 TaxID=3155681 RepID=UPI0034315FEA